jgi:spermidine/putrescine transport system ATP-binding protein
MVVFRNVTKRFGEFTAVDNVGLTIRAGEFLTLLGPSGCGKTTLLRMISGFEQPTHGTVLLDGRDVTGVPPYKRDVNQVFQSYALFPHLSVADNIEFGLRMKRVARPERRRRVAEAVSLVSLDGMEARRPHQLSGGQRQRVALARAIVNQPKVLLLDEPLAALDAKLRRAMQVELKRLQQRLGITFVFVTHDQDEALTMSDRIAVINRGRIEQLGSGDEVYHHPRTTFVANFIGQANIIESRLVSRNGRTALVRLGERIELIVNAENLPEGAASALISFRPEKLHLRKGDAGPIDATPGTPGENAFEAEVVEELFKGPIDQLVLRTESGLQFTCVVANESYTQEAFHRGDRVWCHLHPDDIVVVDQG